jgi:outer membrane biogenesis lipoprotein LolB
MRYKRYISPIFILLLIVEIGCKSSKSLSSSDANLNLSKKQVIRENSKQKATFRTLSSRVKINILDGNKEQSYTVNLRIQKDKQILLMSTPISVVKALITPEKVSFYNKLDNTYFDGDFKYLSDLLGTDLDFQKVQNLLLGETLYDLKPESYLLSVDNNTYILQPNTSNEILEIFFLIDPSHFKLNSQQLSQTEESRFLEIDYLKYQKVNRQIVPENIKIIALEAAEQMIIDLEYKSVSLNEDLRFPFKIPSGYDEIVLK